jgi:hypothetical protein
MKTLLVLFLGALGLTMLLFLPYSLQMQDSLPNVIDPLFYAWNFSHNSQSFFQYGKNLLDTNIFYPQTNTLAFSDTLYAQMPIVMPIIWLTNNPILAENISILLTFPLAFLAMFALIRYLTKNTWSALFGSLFYAFSYPRISQIGHIPALSSQWLPLLILFLLRFLSMGQMKDLAITLLFYLLSITSSIYFGVFALIPMTVLTVYYVIIWLTKHEQCNLIDRIKKSILLFIPFLVILILVLYPYIRLKAEYPEIKRRVEDVQYLQAHLIDYATVLPTSILSRLGFRTRIGEFVLYPTIILVTLSLIGIIEAIRRKKTIYSIFFLIGFVSFILSLGTEREIVINTVPYIIRLPYYYIYKIFPPLEIIRVPARLGILVIFSLSVLSGYAIELIQKYKNHFLYFSVITVVFIAEIWQINTPSVKIPVGKNIPEVYQWLTALQENQIIVELPLKPLQKGDLMDNQLMISYDQLNENQVYALETYRIYFSSYHKKKMINGYSGFFPQTYHDNIELLESFPSDSSINALSKLGVRYIIVHAWQYSSDVWDDVLSRIDRRNDLKVIKQFGKDYIFELIQPI